ncbi:CHAT domain-containing protein [Burkholderiaceae bacterium UC74_6]
MRAIAIGLVFGLLLAAGPVKGQTDEDSPADELAELDAPRLDPAQARALLAKPLPDTLPERIAILQQQAGAAESLGDRPRQIAVLSELAKLGAGRPELETWVLPYLYAEFSYGNQGQARESGEALIADKRYSQQLRAGVALRVAWYAAQGTDRAIFARLASRADGMAREEIARLEPGSPPALVLEVMRLQLRAESERWSGNLSAAAATLRQGVRIGEQLQKIAKDPAARSQSERLIDGCLGMLSYTLVRNGRAPEAIAIADGFIARFRAGELTDSQGARWLYRQANALVAAQRYPAGMAAARESDQLLERAGAGLSSHTRLLARLEQLRGLLGLKRWAEADALYQDYLGAIAGDSLAKERAADWRLRVLLAAENGRLDEAQQGVERILRYRTRLYGESHPQTQEAAGVRGLVRLLRGDMSGAMKDYEQLFVALLDTPGGWLDLELRGARGHVLGVALDQFLDVTAARVLAGQPVEPRMIERALQLADRMRLSSTQRALVDSAAKLRASTPQLAALLEQEQELRRQQSERASALGELLTEEDRQRKEMGTEAFKARPENEREAAAKALKELRARIKKSQDSVGTARAALTGQRERIAQAFPAYGDLVMPPTPSVAQLRALLAPDEALLLIHSLDHATLVWWVAPGQEAAKLHVSKLGEVELAAKVAGLRKMLDLSQGGKPVPLDEAGLLALYRELIAPLAPDFSKTRSLIVASSGELAGLPLAALVTAPAEGGPQPWLLRQAAVTQLPAAGSLQSLRRSAPPRAAAKPLIGFGDPSFKAGAAGANTSNARALSAGATRYDAAWGFRYADIPPLPETRAELQALAKQLGGGELRFGPEATRDAVLAAPLRDSRVVAFATHGLMPGELPGVSKPALAMAATGRDGESPLLELDDVLGLKLNAQWVLLSACNTAAGEQGGAAMTGLVRGFFFAGARSVLATHWSVDSAASASLVPPALAQGSSRAESLRQAQLALAEGKVGGGRWTHPYYWAGYALFGDPLK